MKLGAVAESAECLSVSNPLREVGMLESLLWLSLCLLCLWRGIFFAYIAYTLIVAPKNLIDSKSPEKILRAVWRFK